MECIVVYDTWQMECCGRCFAIGSDVKWLVDKRRPKNLPPEINEVDYHYEAHSGDWEILSVLEGKVESILLLYKTPIGSEKNEWKLFRTDMAAGFEQDYEGMECQDYIVKLTDCSIRPAKEEDLFAEDDEDFDDEMTDGDAADPTIL